MNSSCLLSRRTMRRDNARRRLEAGIAGATIALLLFAGTVVHAEQAPCLRLAERHIDSAQLKNFQATSATHVAAMTRLEPGILAFHAVVEKNDPTRIRVIEMYRDETAHGTHLQSPHFQAFLATTRSMVIEHPWFNMVPVHIGLKRALPPSPVVRVADLEVLPAQHRQAGPSRRREREPGDGPRGATCAGIQEIFRELPASTAGIIYGPSTYNVPLSTKLKQFIEDANKTVCLDLRWRNKVAAGSTSSGTHGDEMFDTFMTMTLFAAQDTMPWMAQAPNPIMTATRKTRTNSTGWATGWMPWRSPICMDDAPGAIWPDNELRTATHLGQRVAEIARRLV